MRHVFDWIYITLGLSGSMAVLAFGAPLSFAGMSFGVCWAGVLCRLMWGRSGFGTCPFVIFELSHRGHEKAAQDRSMLYGLLRNRMSPYGCRWVIMSSCILTALIFTTAGWYFCDRLTHSPH